MSVIDFIVLLLFRSLFRSDLLRVSYVLTRQEIRVLPFSLPLTTVKGGTCLLTVTQVDLNGQSPRISQELCTIYCIFNFVRPFKRIEINFFFYPQTLRDR